MTIDIRAEDGSISGGGEFEIFVQPWVVVCQLRFPTVSLASPALELPKS